MGFKLNVRGASSWDNLLKDLYIEVDNTNWSSTSLSGFLDEVKTALDGKKIEKCGEDLVRYDSDSI